MVVTFLELRFAPPFYVRVAMGEHAASYWPRSDDLAISYGLFGSDALPLQGGRSLIVGGLFGEAAQSRLDY